MALLTYLVLFITTVMRPLSAGSMKMLSSFSRSFKACFSALFKSIG